MVCPTCRKEFPRGTVFCSRCHTTLVEGLAEADEQVERAYPGSSLVQLWAGEDSRFGIRTARVVMQAGIGDSEVLLDAVGSGVYFRVTESAGRGPCQRDADE